MKLSVGDLPPTMHNNTEHVHELFSRNVIPSYSRFDITLERGKGSYVWDVDGNRYLDFGAGIAVSLLGHAHPEIAAVLHEQASRLIHISNLYYNELQGRLAQRIVNLIGPGRCFFCNSGAEANEGLFKLARKFGHEDGRFEIITTHDSFHGRTLAGISATGQEKVKKGFEPMVGGFKQVPFNDLEAMRRALTPQTAAILIEPIQGESGITAATRDYLIGLRQLCDERNLLLLFDEVQAGHFRTGKFHSWQKLAGAVDPNRHHVTTANEYSRPIEVNRPYLPDGIAMAKGIGGGFPIGAFWVAEKFAGVLSSGSHASTFGGAPLACAVALKVFDVIECEDLAQNADTVGDFLLHELRVLEKRFPNIIQAVRGVGLMIGIEFVPDKSVFGGEKTPAIQIVNRLHEEKLLTVPAGTAVVRLLPPLNLSRSEAEEGLAAIAAVVEELAAKS